MKAIYYFIEIQKTRTIKYGHGEIRVPEGKAKIHCGSFDRDEIEEIFDNLMEIVDLDFHWIFQKEIELTLK